MIQKLEALSSFDTVKANQDSISLLAMIRNVNVKFEDQTYVYENVYSALQRLFTYSKNPENDIVKHRETAKNKSGNGGAIWWSSEHRNYS